MSQDIWPAKFHNIDGFAEVTRQMSYRSEETNVLQNITNILQDLKMLSIH